jgi:hypothetical protein
VSRLYEERQQSYRPADRLLRGGTTVGTSSGQPFADVYDGVTPWSTMPLSVPAGATGGELRGISCVSSVRCEASGWSFFGGTPTGMMETYS